VAGGRKGETEEKSWGEGGGRTGFLLKKESRRAEHLKGQAAKVAKTVADTEQPHVYVAHVGS